MGKFKRFRSAITGLFVTRKEAENNPKTTVQETVYDYGTDKVMDSYAQDLGYDDWEELEDMSSRKSLTNHFKKLLKTLKK